MVAWEEKLETFLIKEVNPLLFLRIKSYIELELSNAKHEGYYKAMLDMKNMGLLHDFEDIKL